MKQKIEGGWETEYNKIMMEWIESQWKIEAAHQAGEPYTRMKFEADADKVEKKLQSFISTEIEKAKAEALQQAIEALPKKTYDDYATSCRCDQCGSEREEIVINTIIDQSKQSLEQLKTK